MNFKQKVPTDWQLRYALCVNLLPESCQLVHFKLQSLERQKEKLQTLLSNHIGLINRIDDDWNNLSPPIEKLNKTLTANSSVGYSAYSRCESHCNSSYIFCKSISCILFVMQKQCIYVDFTSLLLLSPIVRLINF